MRTYLLLILFSIPLLCAIAIAPASAAKEAGVFTPATLIAKARANIRKLPWAAAEKERMVAAAEPWLRMSDDSLWDLMFGNTIKRSWMVWSNGYCPACRKSVPMYTWVMDARKHPWKTACPHCGELFPKNDFGRFYRSGLDEHGVFAPARADRALLFNTEHPDPKDPLHLFGVDDGEGYVDGDKRWRFIGAYLIYGQWKQLIVAGIRNLGAAYVLTGDLHYAHKAGVLLDRVADLYPTFDFGREGVMYEGPPSAGYVSTWHDACEETREIVLAYDQVFEGLRQDSELPRFLARRAAGVHLANPKSSFAEIQRNIEDRILRDALANQAKIHSNYPRTEIAVATIMAVLGWPANRQDVYKYLDAVIEKATAVDGVTGEKGLAGYTAFTIRGLAPFLASLARIDPDFLKDTLARHPRLRDMYRFHIDTWCLQRYYPQSGDTGGFALPSAEYVGVPFTKQPGLEPSMYSFLFQLAKLTGDAAFVQVLYHANGSSTTGLPYDLFADNPAGFQKSVRGVIASKGAEIELGSVRKEQWHLAILRSGKGRDARALWLDYDAGGAHGHQDGMNLGLFAMGLDLLPDFGYPPVQYGGWSSPRADWYRSTAAHNTVVVDGKNQVTGAGQSTLWADGLHFRAVRASAPALNGGQRYERTVAMVDVSDRDFYVLDLFRVAGGHDHVRMLHSSFGKLTTQGLALAPGELDLPGAQLRGFNTDPAPQPGWTADWKIEDRYHLLPEGSDVHLRVTDLTEGTLVTVAEAWVSIGGYEANGEAWIPCILTRRRSGSAPVATTFVEVLEPYAKIPTIAHSRRLELETVDGGAVPGGSVAVELALADGRRDLIVSADMENLPHPGAKGAKNSLAQKEWDLHLDGELCQVRKSASGEVRTIALCRGKSLRVGRTTLVMKRQVDYIEVRFERGRAVVVGGQPEDVESVTVGGRSVLEKATSKATGKATGQSVSKATGKATG